MNKLTKPRGLPNEQQNNLDPSEVLEPLTPKIIDVLVANQSEFKKFLGKRISETAIVDDLFQQSIMQAFEKQGTLKQQESVVPWFYQILRNSLIDYYRSRARESKNKIKDPVNGSVCNNGIRKHFTPFADVPVTGENHGGLMLPSIQKIKDLFSDLSPHRDDTPIVYNPEFCTENFFKE